MKEDLKFMDLAKEMEQAEAKEEGDYSPPPAENCDLFHDVE